MAGKDGEIRIQWTTDTDPVRRAADDLKTRFASLERDLAKVGSSGGTHFDTLGARAKNAGAKIDAVGAKASGMLSRVQPIGLALGFADVGGLVDIAVKGIGYFISTLDELERKADSVGTKLHSAIGGNIDLADSLLAVSDASKAVADKESEVARLRADPAADPKKLADAERGLVDAKLASGSATQKLAAVQADANAKAKDFAGTLQGVLNEALRDNEKHSRLSNNAGVNQAAASKRAVALLREHAAAAKGLTEAEKGLILKLADHIEKTGQIPKNVKQTFNTPGLRDAYTGVFGYTALLNGLDGRVVQTTIKDTIIENHRLGHARGAFFGGQFDAKDNIPIRVSRGEAVLNPTQINMLGRQNVMGVLAATGGRMITTGGGYAGGGVRGGMAEPAGSGIRGKRLDDILDRARGRFDSDMSILDRDLAVAEGTASTADDAAVIGREKRRITKRIKQIRSFRSRYPHLNADQRGRLASEEAGLIRQLRDLNASPDAGTTPDSAAAGSDPWALQHAYESGMTEGLGRLSNSIFAGATDIGTGASMGFQTMHVDRVVFANSVDNQQQIAGAGNTGNATRNRARMMGYRRRVAF